MKDYSACYVLAGESQAFHESQLDYWCIFTASPCSSTHNTRHATHTYISHDRIQISKQRLKEHGNEGAIKFDLDSL